ncbi:MAG: N-acetylneuraminate synthase family protein [Clostridia bacterium]|nr:N-acetylneuraminate synthase family protein [Clostridia bacterium]
MDLEQLFSKTNVIVEVSTYWLYENSMKNDYKNAHLLIRYLAIENYYHLNNFGFKYYNLMQARRVEQKKIIPRYMLNNEDYFRKLIKSFEKHGFKKEFPIVVNKNLELVDGSHRLALALYHKIPTVPIVITDISVNLDCRYDLQWFIKEGFNEMAEIIKIKHYELLKENLRVPNADIEPIIIADCCCNHQGKLEQVYKMINKLKLDGYSNVIKFQKRDIDYWIEHNPSVYMSAHPNPVQSFGKTYAEHRKALELDLDAHQSIKKYCEKNNFIYSCTVFDLKSAQEIISLKPKMIKIASSCNQYFELLQYVIDNFKGEIHLSLGMTDHIMTEQIVQFFCRNQRNQDLILYVCTSGYPVTAQDTFLLEIPLLIKKYGELIKGVGLSGHHQGIDLDIAAFVLGARYFERHYTLDKKAKGTDHQLSLVAEEFLSLKQALDNVRMALQFRPPVVEIEKENERKIKW